MIITSLFNPHARLEIQMAVDSDVWMRTVGYDAEGQRFKLGGSVRVRTWAGGGRQHDTLAQLYNLLNAPHAHNQVSLGNNDFWPPLEEHQAKRRYITCDDNRGNYAEILRFQNGVMGIRTIDDDKNWVGPTVWVHPDRKLPVSYEQAVMRSVYDCAFKSRPEHNMRSIG